MSWRDSQNGLSLAIATMRAAVIRPETLPARESIRTANRGQPRGIDQVFAAAEDPHPSRMLAQTPMARHHCELSALRMKTAKREMIKLLGPTALEKVIGGAATLNEGKPSPQGPERPRRSPARFRRLHARRGIRSKRCDWTYSLFAVCCLFRNNQYIARILP